MVRAARPRELEIYQKQDGTAPYVDWIRSIRDPSVRSRVLRRVDRMQQGNLGDYSGVGEGVFELRLFFGPGYRVYFAEVGDTVVLLLCGGDKSNQAHDIELARTYWRDYKERTR